MSVLLTAHQTRRVCSQAQFVTSVMPYALVTCEIKGALANVATVKPRLSGLIGTSVNSQNNRESGKSKK